MDFNNQFLLLWSIIASLVFLLLFFTTAPYGRFASDIWGKDIPSRAGWMIMESPTVILMLCFLFFSTQQIGVVSFVFAGLWLVHYLNRSILWPMRAKIKHKKMSIIVTALAFIFNTINVTIQALWIFKFTSYEINWFYSFPFIFGLLIFILGMYINIRSDNILMDLREKNGDGYHIPKGFLFDKISSPNYLGEIIEWLGWAIMTWNLAGLLFFIWTLANLFPRAISNHKWYNEKFDDYPDERKIIIPNFY